MDINKNYTNEELQAMEPQDAAFIAIRRRMDGAFKLMSCGAPPDEVWGSVREEYLNIFRKRAEEIENNSAGWETPLDREEARQLASMIAGVYVSSALLETILFPAGEQVDLDPASRTALCLRAAMAILEVPGIIREAIEYGLLASEPEGQ